MRHRWNVLKNAISARLPPCSLPSSASHALSSQLQDTSGTWSAPNSAIWNFLHLPDAFGESPGGQQLFVDFTNVSRSGAVCFEEVGGGGETEALGQTMLLAGVHGDFRD